MMNSLSKGKKFLTDLFESSTLAYDQRDEWCTKLKSTQEKGKMDQMLQVQEMRELKKAYDNEIKLYNFLAKKGLKRINMKQEERAEEEKRLKEEEEINLLHGHLKILRDIYDYTKETDIENIIEDFEMREQENFSIYKLLNDFCAENQVLSHEVTKLRRDIDDRRDWNDMMSGKREEQLDNLNKELKIQMTKTREMKDKHDERKQLIDSTMEKISDIFKMLDCSIEPYQNLLGDKEPSLNTFDLSLRLINEKIKEYIHCAYYYVSVARLLERKTSAEEGEIDFITLEEVHGEVRTTGSVLAAPDWDSSPDRDVSCRSKTGGPPFPNTIISILENIIGKLDFHKIGLCIKGEYLSHLRFADDLALLSETAGQMQHMIETQHQASIKVGLEMNLIKTKIMTNNRWKNPITINGEPLKYEKC
ncbi:coiled-coil domain-containing protein 63-like [Bombyx mandarina]|uniref:Coiled-coil domain-containing protein 63-like n=1 Tax=Bombyx mandarina TaxID=7092 RepID=A0A6J2JEW0_BOMMA|nr:coiled-coil domain-containing protein 63-like [Bombyx mandarina]